MKTKTNWFYNYLIWGIVLIPAVSAQNLQLPRNPLEGRQLLVQKGCVQCHSILGEGGKVGSDLGRSQANESALGILAAMWNHSGEMSQAMLKGQQPAQLNSQELSAMLAFFYYLKYFGEPGSPEMGARDFQAKGCRQCHQIGGKGGNIGPALDQLTHFASPILMAQEMWNHGPQMMHHLQEQHVPHPTLQGREIANILAYIQSFNPPSSAALKFASPGNPWKGRQVFMTKKCIYCHRVEGRGGTIGPELPRQSFHRSVNEIAAILWNHTPQMFRRMQEKEVPYPHFQRNEMADLIAYLYFLDFKIESGDPQLGRRVFEQKNCNKCHSLDGYTGKGGPNLARVKGLQDAIKISTAMWNHNIKMQQAMKKQNIPYPRFTAGELKNLLTFIRSIRGQ